MSGTPFLNHLDAALIAREGGFPAEELPARPWDKALPPWPKGTNTATGPAYQAVFASEAWARVKGSLDRSQL